MTDTDRERDLQRADEASRPGAHSEPPVTHEDAKRVGIHDNMAWYMDSAARAGMWITGGSPEDFRELAARTSAISYWINAWHGITIHRAILAGTTLAELSEAFGEPVHEVMRMWQKWSGGQCDLARFYAERGERSPASFDEAEHKRVGAELARQFADNVGAAVRKHDPESRP